MRRSFKIALVAAFPAIAAAGCKDFLTGGEVDEDPNRQITGSRTQLFVGVQATQWLAETGEDARLISMWMQQMAGTDRQYLNLGLYTSYTEGTFGFGNIYAQGGLVDLRKIQADAAEAGDQRFLGAAQVMEALVIGRAAAMFGDIPYSEAVSETETPILDPQLEVYAALQSLLDEAITTLQAGASEASALTSADLIYGGDAAAWTELAHTLKARYYLHTAEVNGASAYQAALAEVVGGISTPENDYTVPFGDVPGQENPWYQFIEIERQGYISPGKFLVDLLETRSDPRLPEYFAANAAGDYVGAAPGEEFTTSLSELSAERLSPAFQQPIVTHAENVLIWAEAAYQTGDQVTALAKLNEARALNGLGPVALAGTGLITEIMLEKYISLFQNLEVWNDWKRTCVPNLAPATGSTIPARSFYPTSERQTNPNIPLIDAQPARNANDPPGGTVNDAAACLGA